MSEDLTFFVCCFFSCFLGGFVSNVIMWIFNYYWLRKTEEERLWNFGKQTLKYFGETFYQWIDGHDKKNESIGNKNIININGNNIEILENDPLYDMSNQVKKRFNKKI